MSSFLLPLLCVTLFLAAAHILSNRSWGSPEGCLCSCNVAFLDVDLSPARSDLKNNVSNFSEAADWWWCGGGGVVGPEAK